MQILTLGHVRVGSASLLQCIWWITCRSSLKLNKLHLDEQLGCLSG